MDFEPDKSAFSTPEHYIKLGWKDCTLPQHKDWERVLGKCYTQRSWRGGLVHIYDRVSVHPDNCLSRRQRITIGHTRPGGAFEPNAEMNQFHFEEITQLREKV